MGRTKSRQRTLYALIVLTLSPAVLYAGQTPSQTVLPDINSPDTARFLSSRISAAPIPDPAPSPAIADEAGTRYDIDEIDDEQDEAAGKSSIRLDGDGSITIRNNKTLEILSVRYRDYAGNYIPEAAELVKHFFRCRLTDEEHDITPGLLEILDSLQHKFGEGKTITLLSGYRSPKLNKALGRKNPAVAKHSLHMSGMAADISIPGVPLKTLRNAALALQAHNTGGVGYYPAIGFIHVDTGEVRSWTAKARIIKHKKIKRTHGRPAHRRTVRSTK
ncbi:MAG: DUF882 domain-containing protein [Elusimicrobiales bacterium]|jgi:uncharacterized protein YcbK (DUF882 family)